MTQRRIDPSLATLATPNQLVIAVSAAQLTNMVRVQWVDTTPARQVLDGIICAEQFLQARGIELARLRANYT